MRVYLNAIGCRLNQSEMETVARQLLAGGHELVADPAEADKVVINTCAVTREAAKDARNLTRRIHRANNRAEIVLTGCYATIAPEELARVKGFGRIVTNGDKERLVQILDPRVEGGLAVHDQEPILREFLAGASSHTRAFVKVQDGCDNRCTFCVTTIARGQARSRRLDELLVEIQALSSAGYREAVLTGVHLGSYGRDLDPPTGLQELVSAVLAYTDISRLRLSSLEPWDIDPGFFSLWEEPRLLPHLHLPLQSGSDRVLRRMARRTTRASFRRLVGEAKACIPELNLSTDLIAGFPGETEADFRQTLDFVAEMAFARLHVFAYSRRPDTAAAQMSQQLPTIVKKERARQLIELGKSLSAAFHRGHLGRTVPVLWESAVGADNDGIRWIGYTNNYIRVSTSGPADLFNQVTATRLSSARPDGMNGLVVA